MHKSRDRGMQDASSGPAALSRTMDGRITCWSPAMEQRYGFTVDQALGQVSHQLLGTIYWQALDEIEAVLIDQTTWSGGLIHRRADGQPIMAANYWHLHRDTDSAEARVTEVHADVVAAGTLAGRQLADAMTTMAHELSQPLTAIGSYLTASQRDLERGWPDRERATQGMARANAQIARATETVRLIRSLGELLRASRENIARLNKVSGDLATTYRRASETV
jgi:signal transduction histidine kinase